MPPTHQLCLQLKSHSLKKSACQQNGPSLHYAQVLPVSPTAAQGQPSTGRTACLQKACKSFPGGLQHAAASVRARSGGSTHNSSLPLQHHEQPWGQQASARRQHHADVRRERRGLELAGHIPMHAHTGMQHSGGAVQLAAFGHLIDKGTCLQCALEKGRLVRIFFFKDNKTKQTQTSALLPRRGSHRSHRATSSHPASACQETASLCWREGGTNPQTHPFHCKQQMGAHIHPESRAGE